MNSEPLFIIVSGPAAAGKTTLSRFLARQLDLPWLSKDTIKAALRGALDLKMAPASAIGHASVSALLAVAAQMNKGAILDCVWRGHQADGLRALAGVQVEVFCRCDPRLLEERYAARQRPADYRPEHSTRAELWSAETMRPVGGRPLIEVDTALHVDIPAVASQITDILDALAAK